MQSEEIEFEYCSIKDIVPDVPCVYLLMNGIELCYVGQTNNLKSRIEQQNVAFNSRIFVGGELLFPDDFDSVLYLIIEDKKERRSLETKLISEYDPKWNYEGFFSRIDYRAIHPDRNPILKKHVVEG